jgi:isoleucyl-tRNA synthetase
MAPFTPFLSEELYRGLTAGESVHLLDWPTNDHVNKSLIEDMQAIREAITLTLAERAKAGIKVRQPLQSVLVNTPRKLLSQHQNFYQEVLQEEVNVKQARLKSDSEVIDVELDIKITPELKQEGFMREAIRVVQNARKQANLNVEDRIELSIVTSDEGLRRALEKHKKTISSETLATTVSFSPQTDGYGVEAHIDSIPLHINLTKSS